MAKRRKANYDLLRICSTFAVVMLHVSAVFLRYNEAKAPTNGNLSVMLLNHIVRFAVPCFLMLSGAFILADEKNADYKYFYKKSIKNIGITGALFCLLYVIYDAVKLIISVFILHHYEADTFLSRLLMILGNLLKGQPYGHLWYLFTLIGLYIAAPFVIRLASDLPGGGVYGRFTIVFLILSSVSYITSEHILKWDIGWQFCFLSYFLMGYKLRKWSESRKSNMLAFVLIISGFAVNMGLGFVNYFRGLNGLPVDVIPFKENPFSYAPLAPIEVIASCLIFAGFSVLKISRDFSKISDYTFLIYLIHAGVWDVLLQIIGNRTFGNPAIEAGAVVAISIAVFTISLLAAMFYKKVFSFKNIKE